MKTLLSSGQAWFDARTVREQRMLMAMVAVIVLCGVWMLIIQPLWAWKAEASERRERAANDLAYVTAHTRHTPTTPEQAASGPPLEPVVLAAAQTAGMTVTTGMDASGAFGFRAANVSGAALFGWLAELKTGHGIDVVRLDVVENADATLTAEGVLSR